MTEDELTRIKRQTLEAFRDKHRDRIERPERQRADEPADDYLEAEKPLLIYRNYDEDDKQSAEAYLWIAADEDGTIDLNIGLSNEVPVPKGNSDMLHLRITPHQARSIAYSLLWYANDLQDPDGWRKRP